MPWNLVEPLSDESLPHRAFSLPLAGVAPGMNVEDLNTYFSNINHSVFDPHDPADPDNPRLDIKIKAPRDGFVNDGDLPHPAIRLHAMATGRLSFLAAPYSHFGVDSLLLEIGSFIAPNVLWWESWREAQTIPTWIIYGDIDRLALRQRLETVPIGDGHSYGVRFPPEVTEESCDQWLDAFFIGDPAPEGGEVPHMIVSAGAYICPALLRHPDATEDDDWRRLRLRVEYQDSSPMNPRELFHLLFGARDNGGVGSLEARVHPLLDAIHNRYSIRPPLRTIARVRWEARREIDVRTAQWKAVGALDPAALSNRHRDFDRWSYVTKNKCNVFVFDIAFRSGFRAPIHRLLNPNPTRDPPGRARRTHYYPLGRIWREAKRVRGRRNREGLVPIGRGSTIWGRRWEAYLIGLGVRGRRNLDNQVNKLNEMIDHEGRCFILANHYQPGDGCSGHVMIIDEFHRQRGQRNAPRWERRAYTRYRFFAGRTLWRIRRLKVSGYEADYKAGARRFEERVAHPHWDTTQPCAHTDNDLVLVELRPGKDPDTREGLEDLNVIAGED